MAGIALIVIFHFLTFAFGDQWGFPESDPYGMTWTPGPAHFTQEEFLARLGTIKDTEYEDQFEPDPEEEEEIYIPEEFDAREEWPHCPTIKEIYDQGDCGSCWAVSSVNAMSDRLCIKRSIKKELSVQEVFSCIVETCEEGDFPLKAYNFWESNGIVSGGGYHSHKGCQPYNVPPQGPPPKSTSCKHHCTNKRYKETFKKDRTYGKNARRFSGEKAMQKEILKNGPISADYDVYEDFKHYESRPNEVYRHHEGDSIIGKHAVRIIGWGELERNGKNIPYWLIANSYGSDWGHTDGFFKMLRGNNECGIERGATAGDPE